MRAAPTITAVFPRSFFDICLGYARVRLALFAAILWGLIPPALAQVQGCAISVQPLAFGAYDVAALSPLTTTSRVDIRCAQAASLSIGIQSANAAHSGQFRSLRHVATAESLPYMLFQDAALTRIWGDGTREPARSVAISRDTSVFIYGAVAAGQDPTAGEYRDTLSIVVLP